MPHEFVISIMARDRVGIVADVTGALRELGGNLADLSQTVLGGYFTMICIVALPATVTAAEVRRRLRAIQPGAPWEVGIRPYRPPRKRRPGGAPGSRYVITASGPDKTGLVATLSGFLREKGINIEDLATLVRDEVYWMVLTVRLPAGSDVGALKRELHAMMAGVGVRCELMHQSIFDATNEV